MPHKSYPLMQSLQSPARSPRAGLFCLLSCDVAGVIRVSPIQGRAASWLSLPAVPKSTEPRAGRSSFWRNEAKKLNDFKTYLIII
jgi:hypothetical protein